MGYRWLGILSRSARIILTWAHRFALAWLWSFLPARIWILFPVSLVVALCSWSWRVWMGWCWCRRLLWRGRWLRIEGRLIGALRRCGHGEIAHGNSFQHRIAGSRKPYIHAHQSTETKPAKHRRTAAPTRPTLRNKANLSLSRTRPVAVGRGRGGARLVPRAPRADPARERSSCCPSPCDTSLNFLHSSQPRLRCGGCPQKEPWRLGGCPRFRGKQPPSFAPQVTS